MMKLKGIRKVGIHMIKTIVKDISFLKQKSELATKEDVEVINNLIDTLKENLDYCVGMAANMIKE